MKMPNHTTKLLLDDGSEIDLTLNFGLLMQVRDQDAEGVKNVIAMIGGSKKEPDVIDVFNCLYTAHLCACKAVDDEPMERDEFFLAAGWNYTNAIGVFMELTNPNA